MPGGEASKQHAVWIVMPGERVVWIPPERLCTGTKGWKRSAVALQIRVRMWLCYMGEVELKRLHCLCNYDGIY